jgi:hypothetical protein
LPSKKCGFDDWKSPGIINGSKPCNCYGIKKYDYNVYGKMECIGKIL